MSNNLILKLSLAALATLATQSKASDYTLFFDGYSDNYTQSVPVLDFFGSWKGAKQYQEGDSAYANNFAQIGVQYQKFSFATFYRYDYYIDMHPDVAEYRYLFHNKRDQLADKDYIYDFTEQRSTSKGLRLGYRFEPSDDLTINTYLNIIHSVKFQVRDISDGYVNGKTKLGDATIDYRFNQDTLFKLSEVQDKPTGYGASLDFDITYKVLDDLTLDVSVKDLFHFIHFDQSPYSIGSFSVNNFVYDEQNVLQQQPLANLKTHEGGEPRSFTQRLPTRLRTGITKQFGERYLMGMQYNTNEIDSSITLQGGYQPTSDSKLVLSYNIDHQAIGLHTRYHSFYFDLITDKVDFKYANSLSLFMGFKVEL